MKLITELKFDIGYKPKDIIKKICQQCNCAPININTYHIIKESIDARKSVKYVLNIAVDFANTNKYIKNLKDYELDKSGIDKKDLKDISPIIVGFGPSGMFCALALAKYGLKPIVLEQGKSVEQRTEDVQLFWRDGKLNPFSNVHYGEGGAGTFSDGKLTTNINNPLVKKVINEFIIHGAPNEIFYKSKPHIGSDNLQKIVKSIREEIISLGGQIIFNSKFVDYKKDNNNFEVTYQNTITQKISKLNTTRLILAIGHSALSSFELLQSKKITLSPKPFAMGVRIEQSQSIINDTQYGLTSDKLPSADYKLVEHLDNGRSVFTFCMCPGGQVVASSSEPNTIVTNGMSNHSRDLPNANSAILVNVTPEDYYHGNALDGFAYQRKYEKLAFELGGSNYNAPAQGVANFLGGNEEIIDSTYMPNITLTDISKCLPDFITQSLKIALPRFEKKLKGFTKNALLIAIESRSSCPVVIERNSDFTTTIDGLYPIGEGAGYAGGIMTSAVDGIKCANMIANEITNN